MNAKLILKIVAVVVGVIVLVGAGAYGWAAATSADVMARTFETHDVRFPIPFPLTAAELADLDIEPDEADRVALERAVERGRHLVEARYGCIECHGSDFSGGVMIDVAPMGTMLGPNLTTGEGSVTVGYGPSDWDRIVRHGVKPDGTPAVMPAEDFQMMSDQELSDIIAYIRSRAPMYGEVPPVALGPLAKLLIATGQLPLSADIIPAHDVAHVEYPPETTVSVEFGRHIAGVCTGCHRQDFAGGPIAAGDPSWVPARNLTPHAEGLAGWTYEQFVSTMTEGVRPDGTALVEPMTLMVPYIRNMTDIEMEALWIYLQSLPALPTPR